MLPALMQATSRESLAALREQLEQAAGGLDAQATHTLSADLRQIVAALGGVLVPLTLERMGLDPALASGTFVTTLTDVMGFLAFLGFATWLLI